MVALMTLGLSSCEKENFSMDIEIPQASPAVVSISPNVVAFIDGSAQNVTNEATISYDNLPVADEKTGKISAATVTINVSYTATVEVYGEQLTKTVTATETVNVPTLDKGMSCTLTPTIFLSIQTKTDSPSATKGAETNLQPEEQDITIKNTTQYFYTDVNGEYQYKTGTEVERKSIHWLEPSFEHDYEINQMINGYDKIIMETKKVENIRVMAQSQTIIKATTQIVSTKYTIKKEISLSRATSESAEIEIVEFTVLEYTSTEDNSKAGPKSEDNPNGYDVNINLKGEEHGHGHGHGNGHGNSANAGGGIIWGE